VLLLRRNAAWPRLHLGTERRESSWDAGLRTLGSLLMQDRQNSLCEH